MRRLLFILVVLVSACKKEKPAAPAPLASVSGELHYRRACVEGTRAPLTAQPAPVLYLTDIVGDMAGTPVELADGSFAIGGVNRNGKYDLRIFSLGTAKFYGSGGTAESVPVEVSQMRRYDLGMLCVDNDQPVVQGVAAEFAKGVTTFAGAGETLKVPRFAGPVVLRPAGFDPDTGDSLRWEFYASEGTLSTAGDHWIWSVEAVTAPAATLIVSADDGRGGRTVRLVWVQLFDAVAAPETRVAAMNFASSADRAAMEKTVSNAAGRWSFSGECCLVAVQSDPGMQTTLQAQAPGRLYSARGFTVETVVRVTSLNAPMAFGLRISDGTGAVPPIAALLSNENGTASWVLRYGEISVAGGPLGMPLPNGVFTIRLSYEPGQRAVLMSVGGAERELAVSVAVPGTPAGLAAAQLYAQSFAGQGAGTSYLFFERFTFTGGDTQRYLLGQLRDAGFATAVPMWGLTGQDEYFGEGAVELPIAGNLDRARLSLADGRTALVYAEDEEQLSAWLPAGAQLLRYEPDAVVPTADPFIFLY